MGRSGAGFQDTTMGARTWGTGGGRGGRVLAVCALLLAAGMASAAPLDEAGTLSMRRFALIVGSSEGGTGRDRLRYAGSDALAVSRVLEEMGGVAPADSVLLLEADRASLVAALTRMRALVDAVPAGGMRRELVLYYSGHSDAEGLLPRGERLSYEELRRLLGEVPVDVRLAILDSCGSGALTREKGGIQRPAFLQDLSTRVRGHAYLASRSADEVAQESDSIGASFFTRARSQTGCGPASSWACASESPRTRPACPVVRRAASAHRDDAALCVDAIDRAPIQDLRIQTTAGEVRDEGDEEESLLGAEHSRFVGVPPRQALRDALIASVGPDLPARGQEVVQREREGLQHGPRQVGGVIERVRKAHLGCFFRGGARSRGKLVVAQQSAPSHSKAEDQQSQEAPCLALHLHAGFPMTGPTAPGTRAARPGPRRTGTPRCREACCRPRRRTGRAAPSR